MQHDFKGIPVESDEDPAWEALRGQALTAAIAMLPGVSDPKQVTDLAWKLACWIRHGELDWPDK